MNNNDQYYQKYLKYKSKYTNLQKLSLRGGYNDNVHSKVFYKSKPLSETEIKLIKNKIQFLEYKTSLKKFFQLIESESFISPKDGNVIMEIFPLKNDDSISLCDFNYDTYDINRNKIILLFDSDLLYNFADDYFIGEDDARPSSPYFRAELVDIFDWGLVH